MKVSLASYPTRVIEETLIVTIKTCLQSYAPTGNAQYTYIQKYVIGSGLMTIAEIPYTLTPANPTCGYTETRTGW